VLPLIIGMAVALAAVALVFAWRDRATTGRPSIHEPPDNGRSAVGDRASARRPGPRTDGPINLAQTETALYLQSLAGGTSFALEAGRTVVLGRGHKCEIVLADNTVSSTHARLEVKAQDRRVAVTDLNSSNGTFLNGTRITSAQAHVGDALSFGNTKFKLTEEGARPLSAPNLVWVLSGIDTSGRALQFELRPPAPNGRAVERATWTIGRDRNRAQLVIDDDTVSGAHAIITYDVRHGMTLRDLGSTNGTRVDGAALGTRVAALSDGGQEITFGAVKLRLSRPIP